jgi:patatin-related protein
MVGQGDATPSTAGDGGDAQAAHGEGRFRELRFALVCYGGVSLAIYMHGVTKEIGKLVQASRTFEDDPDAGNPFPSTDVRHAYFDALAARRRLDGGVVTRVVVDIVSGTSAGGINGVFLAKALSEGRSQDSLRDLWMDRGDINKLLGRTRLRWTWAKVGAWLVTKRLRTPPLSGDLMFAWVKEALDQMDASEAVPSLVPERDTLELYVTTTDFRGRPTWVPVTDPTQVHETEHRHVFRFAHENGTSQFDAGHNAALTFAARATSSFPGAFPPIDIDNIKRNDPSWDDPTFTSAFFPRYVDADANPGESWFVDGGVLDNFPFDHAVRAIFRRPASTEVERRLVYIQPDPRVAVVETAAGAPSLVNTAWASLSSLGSLQPIVDELVRVQQRNQRVTRVSDIVDGLWPLVEKQVTDVGSATQLLTSPIGGEDGWSTTVNSAAVEELGLQYLAYARLKIRMVVEEFADLACRACAFPDDTRHAFFVREAIIRWAEGNVLAMPREVTEVDGRKRYLTEDQISFLRTFDVGYQQRRIQFVIQGVNQLYGDLQVGAPGVPSRERIDALKRRLWELHDAVGSTAASASAAAAGGIGALFAKGAVDSAIESDGDAAVANFASRNRTAMDEIQRTVAEGLKAGLGDPPGDLQRILSEGTADWDESMRRRLVVRFAGFPLWDVIVYPPQRLSDLGELYAIKVARISPEDAGMLSEKGTTKLKGISYGHFGGFLRREWRENDYLWGRFDGAQRLLHFLLGDTVAGETPEQQLKAADPVYRSAFASIIEEEKGTLTLVQPLLADIEGRIARV